MSRTARFSKTNLIAGLVALAVVIPGGAFLLARDSSVQPKMPTVSQEVLSQQAKKPADVTTRADYIKYPGEEGKTALMLLKIHTDAQTKTSSYGEMVTSINGQDGGGTKYWMFYVNGKEASVGAGAYTTHDGDSIEWKLQ